MQRSIASGRGARQVAVPASAREQCTLPRIDYEDAYVCEVDSRRTLTAEAWAREALAGPHAALRLGLIAGWSSLDLRRGRGDATVLGWRVRERADDAILLASDARIGLGIAAQLLFTAQPGAVGMSTFVAFQTAGARLVWKGVEPIHVRVVPWLIDGAAARVAARAG